MSLKKISTKVFVLYKEQDTRVSIWQSSFSNLSLTSPTSQLILQPFRRFTYDTAHSPTLPLLHLRHSSFSNPSFASPTSQVLHLIHLASRPWGGLANWLSDVSGYIQYIHLRNNWNHTGAQRFNNFPHSFNDPAIQTQHKQVTRARLFTFSNYPSR